MLRYSRRGYDCAAFVWPKCGGWTASLLHHFTIQLTSINRQQPAAASVISWVFFFPPSCSGLTTAEERCNPANRGTEGDDCVAVAWLCGSGGARGREDRDSRCRWISIRTNAACPGQTYNLIGSLWVKSCQRSRADGNCVCSRTVPAVRAPSVTRCNSMSQPPPRPPRTTDVLFRFIRWLVVTQKWPVLRFRREVSWFVVFEP